MLLQENRVRGCFLGVMGLVLVLSAPMNASAATAYEVDSDVAVGWFELSYDAVKAQGMAPPVAARAYGVLGVVLYQALVPGMPNHTTLSGQVNQLGPTPSGVAGYPYHWPAVANKALSVAAAKLFAAAPAANISALNAYYKQNAWAYRLQLPSASFLRSEKLGADVANAVLAWAATDGASQAMSNCVYTPPQTPEAWQPTPPAFAPNPALPCWGSVRPFVLASPGQCAPGQPIPYSEAPGSAFYADAWEVYETGINLSSDEATIALYWADGPKDTGTPPGHWIALTSQLLSDLDLSLGDAAEAYARVGMAVADAFIACWYTKYQYNLLRPVTYIQKVIDPAWMPYITTPAFPEYTSGHSTQSGAACVMLTQFFGNLPFTDFTHQAHNQLPTLAPRSFQNFIEAAGEAAMSRLYGGIHYSTGNMNGLAQGECIGAVIDNKITFVQ